MHRTTNDPDKPTISPAGSKQKSEIPNENVFSQVSTYFIKIMLDILKLTGLQLLSGFCFDWVGE